MEHNPSLKVTVTQIVKKYPVFLFHGQELLAPRLISNLEDYPLSADRDWVFNTKVYQKVSGLAAWSENCKWYSSLPLWVSLVSFAAITLCVASQRVCIIAIVYFAIDSVRKLLDTFSYIRS
jgi:hypothetical protein